MDEEDMEKRIFPAMEALAASKGRSKPSMTDCHVIMILWAARDLRLGVTHALLMVQLGTDVDALYEATVEQSRAIMDGFNLSSYEELMRIMEDNEGKEWAPKRLHHSIVFLKSDESAAFLRGLFMRLNPPEPRTARNGLTRIRGL